jgi:hypothetical protein
MVKNTKIQSKESSYMMAVGYSTVGFIIYCNTYLWYHINICTHIYSSELFFFALITPLLLESPRLVETINESCVIKLF